MPRSLCSSALAVLALLVAANPARTQLTQVEEKILRQADERLKTAANAEVSLRETWTPLPGKVQLARTALINLLKDPKREPDEVTRLTRLRDEAVAAEYKARLDVTKAVEQLKAARSNLATTQYTLSLRSASRAAAAGDLARALDESIAAANLVPRGSREWNVAVQLALKCNSVLEARKPAKADDNSKDGDKKADLREAQKERKEAVKEAQQELFEKLREAREREREKKEEREKKGNGKGGK